MEMEKIGKQIVNFQKTIFENSFKAASIFQDQGEKIFTGYINQFPGITADNKKVLNDTIAFTKKTRDEFKKSMDKGYEQFDAFFVH